MLYSFVTRCQKTPPEQLKWKYVWEELNNTQLSDGHYGIKLHRAKTFLDSSYVLVIMVMNPQMSISFPRSEK